MPLSPKEPIPWAAALLVGAAVLAGCGPVDPTDDAALANSPPWGSGCTSGKCDGLDGVTLLLCGPREAATGRGGCTTPSATDIGIDPQIAAKKVTFRIALEGLNQPGVAISLELTDPSGALVRSVPVSDIRDGSRAVYWDGRSATGTKVTAPFHSVQLRATYGDESITSEPRSIATPTSE